MELALAVLIGFILDLIFGDPRFLLHPVVIMGKAISFFEKLLRRIFPKSVRGEKIAGVILAILLPIGSFLVAYFILYLCGLVDFRLRFAVEAFMCYQIFATKSLKTESTAVMCELLKGDLKAARKAVSRIVGRDTDSLDEKGVAKAAIETVAENTADGIIAPLIFMAIGGAPFGFLYKAINTMDSMVGYKNERYINFGMAAARLDDFANFIPARIAGILMICASYIGNFDGKNAARIFRRDRFNHASPNSAQTEAVIAGALDIQLAGDAFYFGKRVEKKTIGDKLREVCAEDIKKANTILYITATLCVLICCGVRIILG